MASDCIFCGIVAGEVPGRDRRLRRAHGRLHGHQPGDPRARAGDPARPLAPTCSRSPTRTSSTRCSPPAGWRGGCARRSSRTASTSSTPAGRPPGRRSSTSTCTSIPRYEDDPLKLPWIPRARRAGGDRGDRPSEIRGRGPMARARRSRSSATATSPSIVLSNPPLNLFADDAFDALMECLDEVEGSGRPGAGLARRGRDLHRAASTSTSSSGSSTPGGEPRRDSLRPAARGRAAARGARDPDPRPGPRALPDRRARGLARLRHDLGRASRRSSAWSRRSSGSPRAPAAPSGWPSAPVPARAREFVMTGGLYDADDARALGRRQPGRRRRRPAREGDAVRRTASRAGPTKAHAATKRIVRAYLDGGVERADEVTPERSPDAVRDRGPAERGPLVPRRRAWQGHVRGR